jgi:hypothetical protein
MKQSKIYEGEIQLGEFTIPCYVLENGVRVLSGRGMQKLLTGNDNLTGTWLRKFISSPAISTRMKTNELEKLSLPIEFKRIGAGGSQSKTYGYEAGSLIDLCDVILDGKKSGEFNQDMISKAEIIIRAVAKVGIIALVDEATGYQYDREKTELQTILKAYISEEILEWQKTFHDQFYKEIFRLKHWDFTVNGIKKRPPLIASITVQYVYNMLPKGTVVLQHLRARTPKSEAGNYTVRLFQSLTPEIGRETLKNQILTVTTLMSVSDSWAEFERLFRKKYGQMDLTFGNYEEDKKPPTKEEFDSSLKGLMAVPPPPKLERKKRTPKE